MSTPWLVAARPPHVYMTNQQISFQRLDLELPIPRRAHPGDAGVDLHSSIDLILAPGERVAVPTGLAIALPVGHAALVLPRSGLAVKAGIGVVNGPGLIDAGYRGEIAVLLINHGSDTVELSRGDRIAQLLVIEVPELDWAEVDELSATDRGAGGFGSSGS